MVCEVGIISGVGECMSGTTEYMKLFGARIQTKIQKDVFLWVVNNWSNWLVLVKIKEIQCYIIF